MPDEYLRDPDWFIDRIDPSTGCATFVRTDVERLSKTVFLDGREPFSSGELFQVPLERLSALSETRPARLILHMSFCGSTQLANLIAASGAAIMLREPQALVDLADWDRALRENDTQDARLAPALNAALMLLGRRWPDAAPTVIKPSNWANNLGPLLRDGKIPGRLVLLTIERRAFLRAAFRGGRDRLSFNARASAHFAAAAGASDLLSNAVKGAADPLDQAARLTLLAHALQARLFDQTSRGPFAEAVRIDYSTILGDPRQALDQALAGLALVAPDEAVATAIERLQLRDSKHPDRTFSADGQIIEDAEVERHHASRFDRALSWADHALAGMGAT